MRSAEDGDSLDPLESSCSSAAVSGRFEAVGDSADPLDLLVLGRVALSMRIVRADGGASMEAAGVR